MKHMMNWCKSAKKWRSLRNLCCVMISFAMKRNQFFVWYILQRNCTSSLLYFCVIARLFNISRQRGKSDIELCNFEKNWHINWIQSNGNILKNNSMWTLNHYNQHNGVVFQIFGCVFGLVHAVCACSNIPA